ncbi:unnamed protein product (macronuclear) [Paramecium tetraurelia]|uniref:C2H2-type domain-containing protein n=1 Tax=Paramecium tetraurelia TaxID=5888 RepID=A0BKC1_PARTE|nr:uncharacterized protein GSPATT00029619001 [Paramecium tetraurelia]CAK58988.1 unnamed protein product [Paramecium tetraurelia]|eukprot:XP_001426386.1 hypothetical protein (macronuclear) [Paramecium tetraurelia strain d4-2]
MKKKSKKHHKKKHHSSSSSSSSKSSKSRSRSRSRSESKSQKSKSNQFNKEKTVDSAIQDQSTTRPYKVNKFALGSMLFENRRTNDRMDKNEVQHANTQLKKIDKSGRDAILLSAAINTVQEDNKREEYQIELVNGQYIKIAKPYSCGFSNCKMRFVTTDELTKHLREHDRVQSMKNTQRAQKFMENL